MTLALTSTTRKILAAALIVTALGAAAPASAADNAQFGFSFGNGNDGFSLSIGNGGFNGRVFGQQPRQQVCLSEPQLRNQLRAQGFRWIDFGFERRGWIHATARKNGHRFEFDVNRCTAQIANIRPQGGWNQGGWNQGGWDNGGWNQGGWN